MDEIDEALEPVLRDVRATTDVALTCRHVSDGADHPYVMVTAPSGAGAGVSVWAETLDERIAAAAEVVQELVIEELGARASNWPMCPDHRSTHPMAVAITPTGPSWTCPATGAAKAAVGALTL